MGNDGRKIRIVVVDDIVETTDNLAKLIAFEPDMEVVGKAFDGEEALRIAPSARPDIVLMDIYMPVMDGITATERLTKSPGWSAAVVMMSVNGEQDYLRRAMLAGAREYLVKPFTADELIDAIRRVYALQTSTSAAGARRADASLHKRATAPTTPETTVIDLMAALRASVNSARAKQGEAQPEAGYAGPGSGTGFCGKCEAETTYESAGGTATFNGIGTKLYDSARADVCQYCGSRRATKFLTLVYVPLLTLGRYRVIWSPKKLFGSQRYLSRKLVEQGSTWQRYWLPVAWAVVLVVGSFLAESSRASVSGSATSLRVGDCFVLPPAGATTVKDVQHRPCAESHGGEVVFVGSLTASAFPGDAAFKSFAQAQCVPAYRSYTGRDFDTDPTYNMSYLTPTSDGWTKGDHQVVCFALRVDRQPITGAIGVAR
jgi:DNA-binding NarL/FixJ family response regulator